MSFKVTDFGTNRKLIYDFLSRRYLCKYCALSLEFLNLLQNFYLAIIEYLYHRRQKVYHTIASIRTESRFIALHYDSYVYQSFSHERARWSLQRLQRSSSRFIADATSWWFLWTSVAVVCCGQRPCDNRQVTVGVQHDLTNSYRVEGLLLYTTTAQLCIPIVFSRNNSMKVAETAAVRAPKELFLAIDKIKFDKIKREMRALSWTEAYKNSSEDDIAITQALQNTQNENLLRLTNKTIAR